MATCEVCENEYDKAFEVVVAGKHHTFDSFECAIHALAPGLPTLQLPDRGARCGNRWANLLLRSLCAYGRQDAVKRPRLNATLKYRVSSVSDG